MWESERRRRRRREPGDVCERRGRSVSCLVTKGWRDSGEKEPRKIPFMCDWSCASCLFLISTNRPGMSFSALNVCSRTSSCSVCPALVRNVRQKQVGSLECHYSLKSTWNKSEEEFTRKNRFVPNSVPDSQAVQLSQIIDQVIYLRWP